MRTVTKSNPEQDFFSFMSKRRKYADVWSVLAGNKSLFSQPQIFFQQFCFYEKSLTDKML